MLTTRRGTTMVARHCRARSPAVLMPLRPLWSPGLPGPPSPAVLTPLRPLWSPTAGGPSFRGSADTAAAVIVASARGPFRGVRDRSRDDGERTGQEQSFHVPVGRLDIVLLRCHDPPRGWVVIASKVVAWPASFSDDGPSVLGLKRQRSGLGRQRVKRKPDIADGGSWVL